MEKEVFRFLEEFSECQYTYIRWTFRMENWKSDFQTIIIVKLLQIIHDLLPLINVNLLW